MNLKEDTVTQVRITRQMSKRKVVSKYLRNKGIKDKAKKDLLVQLLKEGSDD